MSKSLTEQFVQMAKRFFPSALNGWVVRQIRRYRLQWPRAGTVDFGDLRRVSPISSIFGLDRGQPVDRYYIDRFLESNAKDIQGRCLEMGDAYYIKKFGGGNPGQIDVMHVTEGNPQATIVGDLTCAGHISSGTFDCIVFVQTLQMIYDVNAALRTLHRILKPGGVLLLTAHGISKIGRRLGRDDWGEYWHFTTQSLQRLMQENFPGAHATISSYGNVKSAVSYLHGLATEELSPADLDHADPDYEVILTARVVKA